MSQEASLLDVSEARQRLLSFFSPLETELIPLVHSPGRVLAHELRAEIDLPPFPNSAMDGFALLAGDLSGASYDNPISLQVVADIPAGATAQFRLIPGQAARIMTGAWVPTGGDAVAPVEITDFQSRNAGSAAPQMVKVFKRLSPGDNIRPAGQDLQRGDLVMPARRRIRPQETGLLSMLGMAQVPVIRQPRVAVISTGDELLPVEAPLSPGKIRDANSYMLCGLVKECGGQALNLGIIPDRPESVLAALEQAIHENADVIVSSAGVSVGALDFVRSVVEASGHLDFWRVNMRPGKPLAFGDYQNKPFFGLPGNPVSAFVGYEVFIRPALQKLQGLQALLRPTWRVRLLEPVESDGRESYLRAIVSMHSGEPAARLTGHQGSGNLHSLVQANALLLIPSGVKSLPSGSLVDAWMMTGELEW